jgi:hypothetical protein
VLGIKSNDPVLDVIGPIGLGMSVGSALIVDLVSDYGGRTLADIRQDGPRLEELSPGRPGVARIGAGPVSGADLDEVIETLAMSWPALIVRSDGARWKGPTIPYHALYPGVLATDQTAPAVWQVVPGAKPGRLLGVVMPLIGRRATVAMLQGRTPGSRRWIGSWRPVWKLPWA